MFSQGSFQAQLVMILWFPIVLYLFKRFSASQAIIISFIVAWLFLPQNAGFILRGLADYERISATCYGILLGITIFHSKTRKLFKFSWIDVPIIIYCISPFLSSISNGLGIYDGCSGILSRTIEYGLPYFFGRFYLNQVTSFSYLTKGILISALIYMPLCWYEIIMSPQLHRIVYGYFGIRQFSQGFRYGGWRPSVFMRHGLSVGMWMMAGTLIAFWLWQSGTLKKIVEIPLSIITFSLLITLIAIKSTGAYVYLAYGLIVLFVAKQLRISLPLLLLSSLIFLYLSMNVTGQITDKTIDNLTSSLSKVFPASRIESLEFRLDNEQVLLEKALQRPLFGWGGWSRNRIFVELSDGTLKDVTTTDSLWIISYGINGFTGLMSVFSVLLIPPIYFCFKYSPRLWFKPNIAPIAVSSTILVLYAFDCTLNNQFNPVFIVISGGISGYLVSKKKVSTKRKIIKRVKKVPMKIRANAHKT